MLRQDKLGISLYVIVKELIFFYLAHYRIRFRCESMRIRLLLLLQYSRNFTLDSGWVMGMVLSVFEFNMCNQHGIFYYFSNLLRCVSKVNKVCVTCKNCVLGNTNINLLRLGIHYSIRKMLYIFVFNSIIVAVTSQIGHVNV